jgi:lipopolysaccharide/colanic/teichoic acid biosynthesis glycosyltransferase
MDNLKNNVVKSVDLTPILYVWAAVGINGKEFIDFSLRSMVEKIKHLTIP